MNFLDGTTEPGNRMVLITEELFLALVEEAAETQGRTYTVEWGEKVTATHTFFAPTVYETDIETTDGQS